MLINMVSQGVVLSYASSLLPALRGPDSPVEVDFHTASWIGKTIYGKTMEYSRSDKLILIHIPSFCCLEI